MKTAPTNARQEYPQMITTTTERDDRSVQDSVVIRPVWGDVLVDRK